MAIEVGTRAGKYELVQQLGAGGFGLVFLARDLELGRDCALKFLLPEHTGNAEHVQRFLQEARAAARLRHPGIVTVFECGQLRQPGSGVDGMVYIAMELLGGESLSARMKRAALPVTGAVALARQIASAVGAAHQVGIVHRDLKPENVYLVPDPETVSGERVKILDFGIAKLGESSTANAVHTATYQIFGSPHYMSPEQCRSTARVDARTDIYSLGVMLFEMLCGERPFVDAEIGSLIAKHQLVEPPRLRTKVAGLPDGLDELVASMLAKSPDDRPPTMEAVQRALEPFRSPAREAPRRAPAGPAFADAIVATERVPSSPAISPMRPPANKPDLVPPTERLARQRPSALDWAVGSLALAAVAAVIATRSCGTSREAKRTTSLTSVSPTKSPPTPQYMPDLPGVDSSPTSVSPAKPPLTPQELPGMSGADSSLTPDAVLARIQFAYMAGLKRCYKQYLNKVVNARGSVVLSFTVNETGRLVSGTAKGFAAEVDACIQAQMATWRFLPPRDKANVATDADFQITLQLVPD